MKIKSVLLTSGLENRPLAGFTVTNGVLIVDGKAITPANLGDGVIMIPAGSDNAEAAVNALNKAGYKARIEYLNDPASLSQYYTAEWRKINQEVG